MNGISSVTDSPRPGARVAALSAKIIVFRGIHALPKRWDTLMDGNEGYIEKRSHCVPFVFSKLRDEKYLNFKVFNLTHPRIYVKKAAK
jgi:hypothetical protein